MLETPLAEFAVYVPAAVNVYPGPTRHELSSVVVVVLVVVVVVVVVDVVVVLHDPPTTRVPPKNWMQSCSLESMHDLLLYSWGR